MIGVEKGRIKGERSEQRWVIVPNWSVNWEKENEERGLG